MEVLDAFAMENASIASSAILLADIESKVLVICTEGFSGRELSKRAPLGLVFLDLNVVTNNDVPQNIADCRKRLWSGQP
jgi:hypothetical protein